MRREIQPKRWRETLVHEDPGVEAATRLVRRYDAETISFHAKSRVWNRLGQAQVEKATWSTYRVAAAITLVVCLGFFLSSFLQRSPEAPASSKLATMNYAVVTGSVRSGNGREASHLVQEGDLFKTGSNIKTGPASASTIELPELGKIQIHSNSELNMTKTDQGLNIDLIQGSFLASIIPKQHRPSVSVKAGDWTIRVVGTVFEVLRSTNNVLKVNVSRGKVEIEGPNKKLILKAGEQFSSQAYLDSKTTQALLQPNLEPPQKRRSPPKPMRASQTPQAVSSLAKQHHQATQTTVKKNATVKPPAAKKATRPKLKPTKKYSKARAEKKALPKPVRKAKKPEPVPLAPPLSAKRERAMRAITLPDAQLSPSKIPNDILQYKSADKTSDPQKAMTMFDAISESDSEYAELAAHRAAKIALTIGNDDEALRRYLIIRDRFPKGLHTKETAISLIALRLKHCKLHEGRGDLNRFFRENPKYKGSKELAFLSGELHRRTKKYAKALKAYTTALDSRHDEDALYFRAWCMLAIDKKSSEARTVLNDYLKKYPQGRHTKEANRVLQKD